MKKRWERNIRCLIGIKRIKRRSLSLCACRVREEKKTPLKSEPFGLDSMAFLIIHGM